jgi:hypothetical protein
MRGIDSRSRAPTQRPPNRELQPPKVGGLGGPPSPGPLCGALLLAFQRRKPVAHGGVVGADLVQIVCTRRLTSRKPLDLGDQQHERCSDQEHIAEGCRSNPGLFERRHGKPHRGKRKDNFHLGVCLSADPLKIQIRPTNDFKFRGQNRPAPGPVLAEIAIRMGPPRTPPA